MRTRATQSRSKEMRTKKRQEPPITTPPQENFNPSFSEWDILLSQVLGQTIQKDHSYQGKLHQ